MIRSAARIALVSAAAAAAMIAGTSAASAAPADSVVGTSCSFNQLVAATYAISPEEGDALSSSPLAPQISAFLASPSYQRQLLLFSQPWIADRVNQFLAGPGSGLASGAFSTCNQF